VTSSNAKLPFIGKERWSLSLHILKDKEAVEQIQKLGKQLEEDSGICEFRRNETDNAQVLYKKFKNDGIPLRRRIKM
jgi:hypothetical protein